MRRTVDDFRKMSIPDLHDEIMQISSGDMWEGMLSAGLQKEEKSANQAWDEKMVELSKILDTNNGKMEIITTK